jgi:uncharacterized membrane protein YhiD involved in acid resistance
MNDFLKDIEKFTDLTGALSAGSLAVALAITLILALAVAKTYQITYRGVSYSPAFMHTLVLCALVICAVMMIIGSNIARAFSLVGALSIIRFRNAVKDPRDVAYIFLIMGIGMATGTGFFVIAVELACAGIFAALGMFFARFGEIGAQEKIVKIQAPYAENAEKIFTPVLAAHASRVSLLSLGTSQMGTELELQYALSVGSSFDAAKLTEHLLQLNKGLRVQVVGTAHTLDL